MKHVTLLLLSIFILKASQSQYSKQLNSSEIFHEIEKLNVVGSVLYIAAHPDDENTKLITYLANEKKVRTGYLSLTRGDGGQNLIGSEQGKGLGIIRTNELLRARQTDGGEQFFTRAFDFGYSKNPTDTYKHWNKNSILHDVVWVIRNFKPDVIICRFPTTGEGGHGHHTVSALLAEEAFTAAADSTKFKNQLTHVSTWQTKKLFWNTFNFGGNNTTSENQIKVNVGQFNPHLGKSYGEIAAQSRTMHKSQGFGNATSRGESIEYFKQIAGETVKNDLFENIDFSWKRFSNKSSVETLVKKIIATYDFKHPEKSVKQLISLKKELEKQMSISKEDNYKHYLNLKKSQVENIIFQACGIYLEATSPTFLAVPRTMISLNTSIIHRNEIPISIKKINYFEHELYFSNTIQYLEKDKEFQISKEVLIKDSITYSTPFWLNQPIKNNCFDYQNLQLIGKAVNDPSQFVSYEIDILGEVFFKNVEIVQKTVDPIRGEIFRSMEVLPPASISFDQKNYLISQNKDTIYIKIKANTKFVKGNYKFNFKGDWEIIANENEFFLENIGDEKIFPIYIGKNKKSKESVITAEMTINFRDYYLSKTEITYDHIPNQFYLEKCEAKIIPISFNYSPKKIAYIKGSGDEIPQVLKKLNYHVIVIENENLEKTKFSDYQTIITGVRAHNVNSNMNAIHSKLMTFVENGGNLIVQYNTNSRVGPLQAKVGPFPFDIGRNRVTEENSTVKMINPTHKLLTYPNQISQQDFEGWIQERGIYFAENFEENYEAILEMNDNDEPLQKGSIITCKHGKGTFTYTGISFFRLLPIGNIGALKIFINLIHQNDEIK